MLNNSGNSHPVNVRNTMATRDLYSLFVTTFFIPLKILNISAYPFVKPITNADYHYLNGNECNLVGKFLNECLRPVLIGFIGRKIFLLLVSEKGSESSELKRIKKW